HEILVDLNCALAHVVMGDGHHAISRNIALGDAAGQQVIALAKLPTQKLSRLAWGRRRRLHATLTIKRHAIVHKVNDVDNAHNVHPAHYKYETRYVTVSNCRSCSMSACFTRWWLKPAATDRRRSSSCPPPVNAISEMWRF